MRINGDARIRGGRPCRLERALVPGTVAASVMLLIIGCDGPLAPRNSPSESVETGGPPSGSVQIRSLTTGSGFDPDGYGVSVDGVSAGSIGADTAKIFDGLPPGDREIGLFGLSANCELIGTNRRAVEIVQDEVTSTGFEVTCEAGSPESSVGGTDIAFTSHRGGSRNPRIYVMGADGSDPVGIADAALWNAYPAWSPDHRWIAFDRGGDIYVTRPDGSQRRPITSGRNDWWSAWSPDGGQIAFTRDVSGWFDFEIFVMEADGGNPVRLTRDTGGDKPTWSPNGTRIAFGGGDIYVMDSDGSNLRALTDGPGWDQVPAWSPDGTKIAFTRSTTENGILDFDIWVMDADGSNQVNLTRHPAFDKEPAWSPDGRQIAFSTNRDGNYEIYVMESDGSNLVNLTRHPEYDGQPAWSR